MGSQTNRMVGQNWRWFNSHFCRIESRYGDFTTSLDTCLLQYLQRHFVSSSQPSNSQFNVRLALLVECMALRAKAKICTHTITKWFIPNLTLNTATNNEGASIITHKEFKPTKSTNKFLLGWTTPHELSLLWFINNKYYPNSWTSPRYYTWSNHRTSHITWSASTSYASSSFTSFIIGCG